LLLALRDGDEVTDLRGLRVVGLNGVSPSVAAALLAEQAADLTPGQRDRLIEEASGNPLALIELAAAARAGCSTRSVRRFTGCRTEPVWRCWSRPPKTPANSVW
jgi:hypothetical protein